MEDDGLVLVTGGSGYIATFCIADLLKKGYRVRTTVRSRERVQEVRRNVASLVGGSADGLDFATADLMKDDGWAGALKGSSSVLHVASPFPSTNPKSDDELVKPARDGALRVLTAARNAGAKRVVMTSSIGAIAYGHGGRTIPFTEADWTDATNLNDSSAYERSKTIAERSAWDWIHREGGGLELVALNPGVVLGPLVGNDHSSSIDIVKKLLEGKLPGIPRFGWPLVDVRDIVDLHVRAMTAPQAAGQRYIGAGPFCWMSDVANILRERVPQLAKRTPRRTLPDWLIRITARLDPIAADRLYELGAYRPVSAEKAKTELGWSPRPIEETIVATAESLAKEQLAYA